MNSRLSYAVFGLGRYGKAVACELVRQGADVLAVDINEDVVNSVVSEIPYCKCADITDTDVLMQLGISHIDVVVIAVASNLEVSVLATMLCKEIGVKNVIAKCANEMNYKILSKVGADRVVFPEKESGIHLAKALLLPDFNELMELSNDVSIIQIDIQPEWEGKTIRELSLRKRYSINIIAVINDNQLNIDIDPDLRLEKPMNLVVVSYTSKLNKLLGN